MGTGSPRTMQLNSALMSSRTTRLLGFFRKLGRSGGTAGQGALGLMGTVVPPDCSFIIEVRAGWG